MCSSKTRVCSTNLDIDQTNVAKINGRPVLQPNCNRGPSLLERRNSLKKTSPKPPTLLPSPLVSPKGVRARLSSSSPPVSPNTKSPKIVNDPNGLSNVVVDKVVPATKSSPKMSISNVKRSSNNSSSTTLKRSNSINLVEVPGSILKRSSNNSSSTTLKRSYSINLVEFPGSIAAARREQVSILQAMRKMRIAHYGRTKSAKYSREVLPVDSSPLFLSTGTIADEKNRCSFLFPNSDPICVAYHDEEWGVPVYDDKMLFELLVLTTAQVGSDWRSVLRNRKQFRKAFSDFDAELVAKYNERKVAFLYSECRIELSQVRGAIDNANQIVKIKEQFGSFNHYLWRFVNYKPMSTQYKSIQKIPVKTSKSEAISKDMIKRGFRFVGPAVIHSFMQAAGLTNDHLITCPRHSYCSALAK